MGFCIILPIFSCLSKKNPIKPQNPKKSTGLGFLKKPFFLTLTPRISSYAWVKKKTAF